jgi:hypothetical protein
MARLDAESARPRQPSMSDPHSKLLHPPESILTQEQRTLSPPSVKVICVPGWAKLAHEKVSSPRSNPGQEHVARFRIFKLVRMQFPPVAQRIWPI